MFSSFNTKYIDPKTPRRNKFQSCLDHMCQNLPPKTKTISTVGRTIRGVTYSDLLRDFFISKLSYLNGKDSALGEDDEHVLKTAQLLDTSFHYRSCDRTHLSHCLFSYLSILSRLTLLYTNLSVIH